MNSRPRIYLSATRKSSGKTTISAGICGALSARGLAVQSFKKGPDYIDPMWLGRLSGRSCYNLDFNTQSEDEIRGFCADRSGDADVVLIEGNKGLFDGVDVEGSDCNAAMAKLVDAAVVLVVDCEGITRGVAPLINGYQGFDDDLKIDAVILNRVSGSRHESKLRTMIERYTDVEVVGAVHRDTSLEITERHLGLIPDCEAPKAAAQAQHLATAVENQIDLERLLEFGDRPDLPFAVPTKTVADTSSLHIGVAMDSAFCFYYPDDLQELERQVAKVSYFSPLNDQRLPDCDALIIGGGFPETHAAALQANAEMRRGVAQFVGSGRPVYGECGGVMYLGKALQWREKTFDMVGALPYCTTMHDRPIGRGYVKLAATEQHPWLNSGQPLAAHEFHYSDVTLTSSAESWGYAVQRGHGFDGVNDGLVSGNVFASYAHLRNTAANPWINCFLQSVQQCHSRAA